VIGDEHAIRRLMVRWWRITAAKQEVGTVFRSNANANNNLAAPNEQEPSHNK
jgi:hypothetical protein